MRTRRCHYCDDPGPCQAHHQTGAGMGLRAHDHQSMPLCASCHQCFHDASGPFRVWDKARRRDWQQRAVVRYREEFSLQERRTARDRTLLAPDTAAST